MKTAILLAITVTFSLWKPCQGFIRTFLNQVTKIGNNDNTNEKIIEKSEVVSTKSDPVKSSGNVVVPTPLFHQWEEEASNLQKLESSLHNDPDLSNFVDHSNSHPVKNPLFRAHEAHRHDSFLHEIEHSIDSDPDLYNFVHATADSNSRVNQVFREAEAHVHDSLLNEVAHSIDSDPDLAGLQP